MIDVSHDRDHGRAGDELFGPGLLALQALLDLIPLEQLGTVSELLDHQHRGIALDGLVDRGHDAEIHEHFDDFGRLDRHALRQLGHGDRLAERDLALDRRRRHLETVLGLGTHRHGAGLQPLLLLVACADVARDVQFLAPITRSLVLGFLARRRRRMGGMGRMRMGCVCFTLRLVGPTRALAF